MKQGQAVQLAPTDAELERAIASVPGVVSASIDRSASSGRSRMRLRLAPGEDQEAVAWAVAATLRERFGIALDPDAIRPRSAPDAPASGETSEPGESGALRDTPGTDADHDPVRVVHDPDPLEQAPEAPASTEPTATGRIATAEEPPADEPPAKRDETLADTRERLRRAAERALEILPMADAAEDADADESDSIGGRPPTVIPRAAIVNLDVLRHARTVEVSVVLDHAGRQETGHAVAVPTTHGTLRAVAEATVAALRALTEGSLLVGIERVSVRLADDAPTATVILSLLTRRGEERLLGASIVRDGVERAVMRATLDALNRRVTPLLLEHGADFDAPEFSAPE